MHRIKHFFQDLLENHESVAGKFFGGLIIFLIIASIFLFLGEALPEFQEYKLLFQTLDKIILIFFAIEFVARFFLSRNIFRFLLSPLGIIDLLVIIPLFLPFIGPNLIFLRGFRMLEILRIMKVVRYSELMRTFFRSFKHYREEIKIFVLTFSVLWILSSFGIYALEHGVNEHLNHITEAMWWALVTMSTVGYGDIVPITLAGKTLAGFIIILGLGTIAIMTAILTKIFIDHFFGKRIHSCEFCHFPHHDHDSKFCKNCGNPLDTKKLLNAEIIHPHKK